MRKKALWIHFDEKQEIAKKTEGVFCDFVIVQTYFDSEKFHELMKDYSELYLSTGIKVGHVAIMVKDHINLSGINPLLGSNNDNQGPRFPDMSHIYREGNSVKKIFPDFREEIIFCGSDEGIRADQIVWQSLVANHQSQQTSAWILPQSININKVIKKMNQEDYYAS